jgi:hypothetical protein
MDMSKRAFFIIGPEGCGTYMLAEAFVSAGCTYCDKDEIEEFLKEQQPNNLVVRRSLPHAGEWPNLLALEIKIKNEGYVTDFFSIFRDGFSACSSVSNRTKLPIQLHKNNFRKALSTLRGNFISYEYFVMSPQYRKFIFDHVGLPEPEMEFYDGNEKYFK